MKILLFFYTKSEKHINAALEKEGQDTRSNAYLTTTTITATTMKRVNIQLSVEAHTRLKIIAVLKGMTLNDYLAHAVEEAVQRDRKVLEKIPR